MAQLYRPYVQVGSIWLPATAVQSGSVVAQHVALCDANGNAIVSDSDKRLPISGVPVHGVQFVQGIGTAAPTAVTSFQLNALSTAIQDTPAGAFLIATIVLSVGQVNNVTDTVGSIWQRLYYASGAALRVEVWGAWIKVPFVFGTNTITANLTASATAAATVEQYSGVGSVGQIQSLSASFDTNPRNPVIPITDPGNFVFMGIGWNSNTTISAVTGNIRHTRANSTTLSVASADNTGSNVGDNVSNSDTLASGTPSWSACSVELRSAASPSLVDSAQSLFVNTEGQKATFSTGNIALTSVAGVGVFVQGSATKVIRVVKFGCSYVATSTTSAFHDLKLNRYSAISGGTNVADTITKHSISNPAATAVVDHVTAVNTTQTLVGTLKTDKGVALSSTAATTDAHKVEWDFDSGAGAQSGILQGTGDFLGLLFDAATCTYDYWVTWTEE